MSRYDRFGSSDISELKGPADAKKIPNCLTSTFKRTKAVQTEIQDHGMPMPRVRFSEEVDIALAKYKEDDAYISINECLRQHNHIDKNCQPWENTISVLNYAIHSRPDARPGILYHGFHRKHASKLEEGSTIVLKGFTSCSREKAVAAEFAKRDGTVFQINNWRIGKEMEKYRDITRMNDEAEVLLPPYLKFRVTNMGNYHAGGQTIQVDQV